MQQLIGQVTTENPQRLAKRLAKHWAHKFPVTEDEQQISIELTDFGRCVMCYQANGLLLQLSASAEQLAQLKQVVVDHLLRMASKETLAFSWQTAE